VIHTLIAANNAADAMARGDAYGETYNRLETGFSAAGDVLFFYGASRGIGEAYRNSVWSSETGSVGSDIANQPKSARLRDKRGRFTADPETPPSPYVFTDSQRRAAWKKLAEDPTSPLTAEERAEIKARGWRGPQRYNEYGELETMELSHEPVPLRDGGAEVVPRWPAEHAEVDSHRTSEKTMSAMTDDQNYDYALSGMSWQAMLDRGRRRQKKTWASND
jgi:hypothetical protein